MPKLQFILRNRFVQCCLVACCLYLCASCTADTIEIPSNTLRLRYHFQAPLNNLEELKTGLKWYFSYLGAPLHTGDLESALIFNNSPANTIELDIGALHFNAASQHYLYAIIDYIKASTAYQRQGYIDLGRFVMLTLNSSKHYYKITNAATNYTDFLEQYNFEDTAMIVLDSSSSTVSNGHRILFRSKAPYNSFKDMAFIAVEGSGDYSQQNFVPTSYEVFDFMDNGQPRFAIYDTFGILKTAASPQHSLAGKPSKCMWCHESGIQPNFTGNNAQIDAFNSNIATLNAQLSSLRYSLPSDLDYQQLQEHSLAELLYVTFMEPSKERVAAEWNLTLQETQSILQHLSPVQNNEFSQMGLVYQRHQIDSLNPSSTLKVPENYRDSTSYEPDF